MRLPFPVLLKTYRERKKLSQAQLALRAGFDHTLVSRLESGKRDPSRETVLRLASALGLSATERHDLLLAAGFLPFDVTTDPDLILLARLLDRDGPLAPHERDFLRRAVQRACTRALTGDDMTVLAIPSRAEANDDTRAA